MIAEELERMKMETEHEKAEIQVLAAFLNSLQIS